MASNERKPAGNLLATPGTAITAGPPVPPPRPNLTLLAASGGHAMSRSGEWTPLTADSSESPGGPNHGLYGHVRSSSARMSSPPALVDRDDSHAPPSPLSPGIPSQSWSSRSRNTQAHAEENNASPSPPNAHSQSHSQSQPESDPSQYQHPYPLVPEARHSISVSSASVNESLNTSAAEAEIVSTNAATSVNGVIDSTTGAKSLIESESISSAPVASLLSTAPTVPSITGTGTVKSSRTSVRSSQHHHRRASLRHHLYLDDEAESRSDNAEESRSSLSSITSPDKPKESRVDVSVSGEIKLASLFHLQESSVENKFANDFVPTLPSDAHVDALVLAAMDQLTAPLRQIVRDEIPFKQEKPKRIRLLDFEVDEPLKAVARAALSREKAKKTNLSDVFVQPNSPTPNPTTDTIAINSDKAPSPTSPNSQSQSRQPPPSPSSSSSPSSDSAVLDAKYEDLGAAEDLVDPSLFVVGLEDAINSVKLEQVSASKEGFFWRSSPLYKFEPSHAADAVIVKRHPVNFWTALAPPATQLLVSVHALKLGVGHFEPLYCSLAIFDLKHEERCSEEFHFDLNDLTLLTGHLQVEAAMADPLTLCKHAIFSLIERHRHEHTVLVLRIERILAGDQSQDLDFYLKTKLRTPQELSAMAKKIRSNLLSLSEYRQPFAWSLQPLFDSNGELRAKSGSLIRIERIWFQSESVKDDQLIAMAKEAQADGGRKQRPFPASSFEFRLDELDPACLPPNRVDPCCIPLKDTPAVHALTNIAELNGPAEFLAPVSTSTSPNAIATTLATPSMASASSVPRGMSICKDILDFSAVRLPLPLSSFINLLYVYPEWIKFDKYRNIACRVQVRANDAVVDIVGQGQGAGHSTGSAVDCPRLIMGKSSTSSFCSSALTSVNYHKRSVNPQDEVKVMLPMNLTTSHHLFFTFYKVSCKNKPGSREIIGYSLLPIFPRHRLVANDTYTLPIAAKLPKGYLAPFVEGIENAELQFRHNGTKSFSVRIRGVSSVFNSDENINAFLQTFPNVKEVAAIGADKARDLCNKAVESIPRCDPLLATQFMPALLDYFFDLIVTRGQSPQSQYFAFLALTYLIARVSEHANEIPRCSLLSAYIHYRLDNRHNDHPPVFTAISRTWLAGISVQAQQHAQAQGQSFTKPALPFTPSTSAALDRSFVLYAWFYFECMTKSLALARSQSNALGALASNHLAEFIKNLQALVAAFVRLVHAHRSVGLTICKSLVNNLAAFFLDLFHVLEKRIVLECIADFCHGLRDASRDPVIVEMKFTFHAILLDHPAYLDLAEMREFDCEPFEQRIKDSQNGTAPLATTALSPKYGDEAASGVEELDGAADVAPHPQHGHSNVNGSDCETSQLESDPVACVRRDFLSSLRSEYFLTSLFLSDYCTHLSDSEPVIREQVIDTLRNFLTKVDYDRRWRSAKSLIATMLFPLLPALLDEIDTLASIEPKLRRSVLAPVLFLLHQIPSRVLTLWWHCEPIESQCDLLELLRWAITDFSYCGIKYREEEIDSGCILAPESMDAIHGGVARTSSIGDYKTDIESLMQNIHKTRNQAGSRARLQQISHAQQHNTNVSQTAVQTVTATSAAPALDRITSHRPSLSHSSTLGPLVGSQLAATLSAAATLSGSSNTGGGASGATGASAAVTVGPGSLRQLRANLSSRSLGNATQRGSKTATSTITGGSLEFAINVVRMEGALTRQAARIVVRTFARFLRAYDVPSLVSVDATFLGCIQLLTTLLTTHQPNSFLVSFYPLVLHFVQSYGHAAHANAARQRAWGLLANAIFRTCAFTSRGVRKHAVTVVYELLMNEFRLERDLTHSQIQLTIALSKLTDSLTTVNERCLQQSFQALMLLGDSVPLRQTETDTDTLNPNLLSSTAAEDFKAKLTTLVQRLATILGDSMEISRQAALGSDADSAISENLLCQVADAFSHLPEIRIEWLCRLAKHHQRQQQFAEAGQCYLLVATLAASLPAPVPAAVSTELAAALDSDRVVMSYYEAACSMLDQAELYEQCSDVYQLLLPLYHRHHEYARLSKCHLHLHSIFEKLIAANASQTRMLGTYYRVGFYGRKFGPRLDGIELIYKTPKITRLSEIASRMRSLYGKQLSTPVRILPDSGPVDRSKLDPEECVLQVTFVAPYFGGEAAEGATKVNAHSSPTSLLHTGPTVELQPLEAVQPTSSLLRYTEPRPRTAFIERHSFIRHFKFSTPLTSTGKAFGSVSEQQKRNTFLSVKHPFPSILSAQVVVAKSERVLSPIESATDDVNIRTAALTELLDAPSVSAKQLTILLQGSVATQVNGGAREICLAFLELLNSDEDSLNAATAATQSAQQQDQRRLRVALRSFLAACVRGLELNAKLCQLDSEREFQANLERQYEEMLKAMKGFLYRERVTTSTEQRKIRARRNTTENPPAQYQVKFSNAR